METTAAEARKARRELYIRVMTDRILYISAGVGEQIGDDVDVYERCGVLALVGTPKGRYHSVRKSKRTTARNLVSQGLVEYLSERLGCEVGDRLCAWTLEDEEAPVVYAGREAGPDRFSDGGFSPVEVHCRRRVQGRVLKVGNRLLLPGHCFASRPERLTAYRPSDGGIALLEEREGVLPTEQKKNKRYVTVNSRQLVELCEEQFGKASLIRAITVEGGVMLRDWMASDHIRADWRQELEEWPVRPTPKIRVR